MNAHLKMSLPPDEFNVDAYKRLNKDLAGFSSDQLINHYHQYGKNEGRCINNISNRYEFLSLLAEKKSLLEIGVFDSPSLDFLSDWDDSVLIHYADFLSRDDLVARAEQILLSGGNRDPLSIPEIRWVLSNGYEQIDIKYDAVVSHHCVEHQPVRVSHLKTIKSILSPGGWYLFSLPHKNNCFDHFIPSSTIVDVLDSYYLGRKSPSFSFSARA